VGVELRPLGVQCNIQCQYCYQNPQRDAGNVGRSYDLERMKAAVERAGGPFALFGGEPLLVPEEDLERLWSWGLDRYGSNAVQTNGTLINDEHIRLFKAYRVNVGISLDGPGDLNSVRRHGSIERTRQATRRSEEALKRLCREGLRPSLIVTLHRENASSERLPILHGWLRELDRLGVRAVRLHLLESESDDIRRTLGLTAEENTCALLGLAALEKELGHLEFDLFSEMRRLLLGQDQRTSCVWNACDPYTTQAVQGIEGHGERSNCGRTNKDGVDFVKSDVPGYERYLTLYATRQEAGGCAGCRFFLMCKGQCPGTAIDGDWRNRTEHCDVWKALFTHLETELLAEGQKPLSRSAARPRIEQTMLGYWRRGRTAYIAQCVEGSGDGTAAASA
jgi:uncharacterized protein